MGRTPAKKPKYVPASNLLIQHARSLDEGDDSEHSDRLPNVFAVSNQKPQNKIASQAVQQISESLYDCPADHPLKAERGEEHQSADGKSPVNGRKATRKPEPSFLSTGDRESNQSGNNKYPIDSKVGTAENNHLARRNE